MKLHAEVDGNISPLTKRENEIFGLLAEGLSQREMSDKLHRSLATISTHITHIKDKLDADNGVQAVAIGVLNGFLSFTKTFAIYGLVLSSVLAVVSPTPVMADDEDHHPIQRVMGRCKINRVRGRKSNELGLVDE